MSFINQDFTGDNYKDQYTNIKNYILYALGYPLVRVELVEEHLVLAIVEALNLYYDRAAHDDRAYRVLSVSDNNIVDIPADISKNHIEDVIFPITALDSLAKGFGGTLPEADGAIFSMGYQRDFIKSFDLATYLLYSQRIEDFRNALGIRKHWEILNNQIVLYPPTAQYGEIGIIYKQMSDEKSLEQQQWIKDYSLARAKHILGTIRSKMSGFQAANANIGADGEALKSEANEAMTKLKEDLDKLMPPLPFMQI